MREASPCSEFKDNFDSGLEKGACDECDIKC